MPLLRNPTPGPSLHRFVRSKRDDKEREKKYMKRQSDQSDIPIENERERGRERKRGWMEVRVRACVRRDEFFELTDRGGETKFPETRLTNRVKFDSFLSERGEWEMLLPRPSAVLFYFFFFLYILFADDFYVFYISVRVYLSLFANGVRLVRVCVWQGWKEERVQRER